MTDCVQLEPNYDAYTLGVLEGAEREEIEAHLARGCPTCTAGMEKARGVVAQLAYLAPEAEPPVALRARVLEAVQPRRRARLQAWAWGAAAAALLLFSLLTAQRTRQLRRELANLRVQLEQQRQQSLELESERQRYQQLFAVLSDPSTRALALKPSADAPRLLPPVQAYWHKKVGVVLLGRQIPAPAADRTFQLWVVPKKGNPISGGTFRPDQNGLVLVVSSPPATWAEAAALAITDEPAGGRPQPTTKPLWVGPVT